MLKDRNDSRWSRIIVVGSEGIPKKVYELNRLGQLVEKFPKQPYRKNEKNKQKIPSSQSCPILVENKCQNDKAVVSKFINAILKYNENDMTMMKLCYEQQQKQVQFATDAQTPPEQEQLDLLSDFDSDNFLSFSPFFDELINPSENINDFNFLPPQI